MARMLELSNRDLKISMVKILKDLVEMVTIHVKRWGNRSREMDPKKRSQMEILEMKSVLLKNEEFSR